MSADLYQRLLGELEAVRLIDPHSHINPHAAAAKNLADILGYHYYTELAHSAGMPRAQIEEPDLSPRDKVERLVRHLEPLRNTIQYSWLLELAREFFDFPAQEDLTLENWETLYDTAVERMSQPDWEQQVIQKTNLDGVFLTNDFDDSLEGFDTSFYVPCLRTDDLVFHLAKPDVRQRLAQATNTDLDGPASLRAAIGKLFAHFLARGAQACAISLPPSFTPRPCADAQAADALDIVLRSDGETADDADAQEIVAQFVFWTLAEHCDDHALPFDLMIGVNRGVYAAGVFQGQDLYDSRVSLIQYKQLFNAFGRVTFPISVLASVTNQELVSYAWIFPNVVTNGHWWYSNTPAYIEQDAAARLEAVPATKQIGYYSDMYKLEFALPKFAMYRRILARLLARRFVIDRGWSETRAVAFGRQVLRGNVERIFGGRGL